MFGLVWAKSYGFLWDCPCQTKQYRANDLISWMCSHFQSGNSMQFRRTKLNRPIFLVSNMFCTYNYCCLNGLVNSFHFFDCFGVTLSFVRMPYLPIFLFIRPLTHQLFNFLSYTILIRSIFPKNTSNHVQTGWKKLQVLRPYFLSPWTSISISASKNLWDIDVRHISSMSGRCRKTPLTVILKDVMAPAECYVSRSLWGSRQLAITLQLETGELLGDLFWGESLRMGKQI